MAQIGEMMPERIDQLQQEPGGPVEEGEPDEESDDSNLMQASAKVVQADSGPSTFGVQLKFLTDELSALPESRARARAEFGEKVWATCGTNGNGAKGEEP